MKLEFSGPIFEKSSNIKYHENPPSWNQVVLCGQIGGWRNRDRDRLDGAYSCFLQFCEHA
jgi:hypothetical protein